MEGLVTIAVIAALAAVALILVVLAKLGSLSREMEEVKRMVRRGALGQRALPKPVEAQPKPIVAEPEAPEAQSVAVEPPRVTSVYAPTAADRFWATVEDWFCVRGKFAPKGVTREFAVATRWLLRVGSLLLVGAMAYFITLAINRGWIGPVQRVYGMMFWGVVGIAVGTWLKVKSERYSILGEVFAALGLVALYLSFGLGHRYFDPPVIGSVAVAFAGLVVATVSAGVLSVRLKSLTIAALGLVGGFLVPMICSFSHNYSELVAFLAVLTVGAAVVAYLRRWTALGFAAIAVAFVGFSNEGLCRMSAGLVCPYCLFEYALVFMLTVAGLKCRSRAANAWCWTFVMVSALVMYVASESNLSVSASALIKWNYLTMAAVHAVLAWQSRKRDWGCTPMMIVLSVLAAAGCLFECCAKWHLWDSFGMLVFCAFAAILAELSMRTRERTLAVLSLVVTTGCGIGWVILTGGRYDHMSNYWAELGSRSMELWCLPTLLVFLGARLAARGAWLEKAQSAFFVGAAIQAFILVTAESKWFGTLVLPSVGSGCITIVWATIAFGLLAAGVVRRWKVIRLCGLGLLGFSVFKVLFFDTASLATPARVAVFAAVGVLMIVGAFLYLKFRALFEAEPDVPAANRV